MKKINYVIVFFQQQIGVVLSRNDKILIHEGILLTQLDFDDFGRWIRHRVVQYATNIELSCPPQRVTDSGSLYTVVGQLRRRARSSQERELGVTVKTLNELNRHSVREPYTVR